MAHIITLPAFGHHAHASGTIAKSICEDWASAFEQASPDSLGTLFTADAWIRDFLALSWDFRTISGRDNLLKYLNASDTTLRIRVSDTGAYTPAFKNPCPGINWLETMFSFETRHGRGKGMLRLVLDQKRWKCYLINLTLQELKGHEEKVGIGRPSGHVDPRGGNWQQHRERQKEFSDGDPAVIVIGAAGLTIAARLEQLNVPTLVIERSTRVGDSWRKRYKTLMTHDPIHYCHLPYIPFPAHWPYFMPKDKLADWLEAYATLMELNIWCETELLSSSFDNGRWTVSVKRNGEVRTLNTSHVVLATGNVGDAITPQLPGQSDFQGLAYHASEHTDASSHHNLTCKNVVVVGSGNSAHDISQNFYESGAASVTMLQRGGTYVLTADKGLPMLHTGSYEEGGPPTEDCDIAGQSLPIPVQFALNVHGTRAITAVDKDTLDGLAKVGFKADFGEDNSGIYRKYITRGGGYYIDVGCSRLLVDGKVKVKSCTGISHFARDKLVLADGAEVEADIVVFATGYETMHSTARKLFGDKVGNRLGRVWDLNEEGEVNSRPPSLLVHGRKSGAVSVVLETVGPADQSQ